MNSKKIYIFGSGISGCTVARIMAEKNFEVNIYETKANIGGNCFDYIDDKTGIYIHKYGPHIFHTSFDEVWNFVTRFSEFNGYQNKVKVNLENKKVVSFPISFKTIEEIYEKDKAKKIINLLKENYKDKSTITIGELIDSKDNELKEFSNYVYENVYSNYTSKMWGIDIKDIDPNVLKRVKINLNYSDNYFPDDKYQGIPTKGYTSLMKKMINHPNIKLELNFDFKNRCLLKDNSVYLDSQKIEGHIFFCGPIDELFEYKFGKLPYRSLNIEFETYDKKQFQEVGVINYPWHKTMTRITEYKYLSKQESLEKTIISKEFPGQWDEKNKLFNVRFYPIENPSNNEMFLKYKKLADDYKIIPLGRLSNYKYFDMDDAILNAMKTVNKIFE